MSPPHVVIQAVDDGAIAFLEHGPAVPVHLVYLHEEAEEEHHTPIPTAVQACFELGAGSLVERRRRDELEENKVHPHVVTTWKGPAVDKLFAKEVLVTHVKAAKDLDLSPVVTTASTVSTSVTNTMAVTMLHVSQQQSNIIAVELFVASVRWRKPDAGEPTAMQVVQLMGYLFAEISQF